jgi:hypothetical protein
MNGIIDTIVFMDILQVMGMFLVERCCVLNV